jgi:hypothetical protein
MRFAIAALVALAIAAPATAQQSCQVSTGYSDVSGVVRGTTLEKLTTKSGPAGGFATINETAKGFTRAAFAARLYYYRVGSSVAGKDWREPGSVATEDGGFIMTWPIVLLNGVPAKDIVAELTVGDMTYRRHILNDGKDTLSQTLFVKFDSRLQPPAEKHTVAEIPEADWQRWREAFINAKSVYVDLFDATGKQQIVNFGFRLLDRNSMQERLVVNVNALRKAVADGTCNK